jgi:hypothetical protein
MHYTDIEIEANVQKVNLFEPTEEDSSQSGSTIKCSLTNRYHQFYD